jgi:hypothetical protein
MDKRTLARYLRAVAKDLEPLTRAASAGGLSWDGYEYAKSDSDKQPDPYALAWWSMLNAVAEMIDYQDGELSSRQISYLQSELFGGMGSLNDLWFDERRLGRSAKEVNENLKFSREALFGVFKNQSGNH